MFFVDNMICRNYNHLQPFNVWRSCLFDFYVSLLCAQISRKAMLTNNVPQCNDIVVT